MKKPEPAKPGTRDGKRTGSDNRKGAENAKKQFTSEHNISRLRPKPGSGGKA